MLTLWKKRYDQTIQHIKKQSYYFANKGLPSQSYGFSSNHVWMWELGYKESWAPKKYAFELWCCRRLLRVPWTVRRSNQSILKEISPEYSLEELMLKLKLQYFVHLIRRTDSLEKTLMLEKIESRKRRGWQRMRWLDGITTRWTWAEQAPGVGDGQGSLACCSPWGLKGSDTTEWLNKSNMPNRQKPQRSSTLARNLRGMR